MQTRTDILTGALNAIIARVDGRFDDPDLAQFGPLHESIHSDCGQIARIALQKAAPLPMPSTTVNQATEFESAAALLTSRGFVWKDEQWHDPKWRRVASATDTDEALEVGRRLPALPPILDDYEAASSAMRRKCLLEKNLFFLPLLCSIAFIALGIWNVIAFTDADELDTAAGVLISFGLLGLLGSLALALNQEQGPLDDLDAGQLQELTGMASENCWIAQWLATAIESGKTVRLRDLGAAQRHNSQLSRIRQSIKQRTDLEAARADLHKTAHEHSTLVSRN